MPHPKVSVCIDVFNYAEFLSEAIESVLKQTFTDFEVIIVDDCSNDQSFEMAESYAAKDNRIRVLRNTGNLGMIRNRNACLAQAGGEYVKFIHADDCLCSSEALGKMAVLMDSNPALVMVASQMRFVDADGHQTGLWSCFERGRLLSGTSVIIRCLREQRNLIGGPSAVMFRRARSKRGFDESYFHSADLEMWFHLLEQGCFGFINEPLCAYRWHPRQQTEKDRNNLAQALDNRALLSTYLTKSYATKSAIRPWMKKYLTYDATRQIVKRSIELGVNARATEAIADYGRRRYHSYGIIAPAFGFIVKGKRFVERHIAPRVLHRSDSAKLLPGINVAGFFAGEYGIGEASRAFAQVVQETGLPYALVNINARDHRNFDNRISTFSSNNPYRINLMCFSFDYARRFYKDKGHRFFDGRYNIAIWHWEFSRFPAHWHSAFDYYDEIWAVSDFCHKAIADVSPIPVSKVTYPIRCHSVKEDREAFGLKESDCIFMFGFDFLSLLERKNPLAVIEAFRMAFGIDEEVMLLLKTINSHRDQKGRRLINEAVQGLNVIWLESHLTGKEMDLLLASVDCYVSLHRSEGFGLGMAQAMALGKPVIATGYSGNMEFMDEGNSLLVKYDLVELKNNYGRYEKGNVWAEAKVRHAAELMRWVFENREAARQLGERAAVDIKQHMNPLITKAEILAKAHEVN